MPAELPGVGRRQITAVSQTIHGVECYEAWRNGDECPHESRGRQHAPVQACGLRHTGPCTAEGSE